MVLSLAPVCGAQATLQLRNSHVLARFGPRGLLSIEDLESDKHLGIQSDEFSISIGNVRIESTAIAPKVVDVNTNQIVYSFESGDYILAVAYELQSSWKFVTKQIRVARAPGGIFTMHDAQPIRMALGEAIESSYVPGAYFPHFGETREESRARGRGADYGVFARLSNATGAMFLVQNPFLKASVGGANVSLEYSPEIEWDSRWGEFATDRACVGVYTLTGERLPAEITPEWKIPAGPTKADGMDRAEIGAFTDCVRRFLVNPAPEPISVEVGWTLNDYQIDVATTEGRAEYKRVIDTAAELGIRNLLYAPKNSELAQREDDLDDWNWEHVLWLGFGQKIRKGEWNVQSGVIPASVSEMLDYAKNKKIGLLAYVYPSLPFAQSEKWIVTNLKKNEKNRYANLASREFQDFLIRELLAFKRRMGIAGFAFDYTFLNLPGASQYAQWLGWKRVMETLKREEPDIVIDGRQTYQTYGPWSWLAGSYPHPTGTDEQPESFTPYPDLHFDRVSADRERYVDYWYRNFMFAPEEVIPGYMTHQTERSRNIQVARDGATHIEEQFVDSAYRARDWDYLGFKYSVISSIASGGWNNVMDMIPGRDLAEFQNFSAADKNWIRDWIDWTREHKEFLRNTRTILGPPAMGTVDGTSAIASDRGFIFLFNPNYEALVAQFKLNETIGLEKGKEFVLREVHPRAGNLIGGAMAGVRKFGEEVEIRMRGTDAMVIEVAPAETLPPLGPNSLRVFNGGPAAKARLEADRLAVDGVSGEVGGVAQVEIEVPQSARVAGVTVNGVLEQFARSEGYVRVPVIFEGVGFAKANQVELQEQSRGSLAGDFLMPKRALDQLAARKKAWPIPWTKDDYETTWLAPERLLLFVQIAEPKDSMQVSMTIDGRAIELKKAYSSVRAHAESFVGYYADVSGIAPDVEHKVVLNLPPLKPGQFRGLFFDNVEPEYTDSVWKMDAQGH